MPDIFESARWYELGINWDARLSREIPVLRKVFGPPGDLGVLDAGCGPGRQLVAMAQAGYRVCGVDRSAEMLVLAREHAAKCGVDVSCVEACFDEISPRNGSFDGIYCLGNSLAATGKEDIAEASVAALASVLRPGGKLFVQILNFDKLRAEEVPVRGPRVRRHGSAEYVSTRVYSFYNDEVEVTNVTCWQEEGWKQHAHRGRLYAISADQLQRWFTNNGLEIDAFYGDYQWTPFDGRESADLIVVATRKS